MALIKCPQCGKEITDHVSSCPHCGTPIGNKNTVNFVVNKLIGIV